MRLIPTLAALLVTLCWLGSIALLWCGLPWAWFGVAGTVVNGFCLVDVWRDAWKAWTGAERAGLGLE
jgi:hypothetical protein